MALYEKVELKPSEKRGFVFPSRNSFIFPSSSFTKSNSPIFFVGRSFAALAISSWVFITLSTRYPYMSPNGLPTLMGKGRQSQETVHAPGYSSIPRSEERSEGKAWYST